MNNLEQIKAAWAMGWSAVFNDSHVVAIPDKGLWLSGGWTTWYMNLMEIGEAEITGYLYAGELAGNEPIPEGQKFRVKESGRIVWKHENIFMTEHEKYDAWKDLNEVDKSEIEPVFE